MISSFYSPTRINTIYRVISDRFKGEIPTNILGNLNKTLISTFIKNKQEYWTGERSLMNFKRDIAFPFELERVSGLSYNEDKKAFCFRLFSIPLTTYLGKDYTDIRKLLERLIAGETKLCTSQIQLKDGKTFLLAVFEIEKEKHILKPEVIAEASLSLEYPIVVVNRNGSVFSYIVKYKKQLDRLNYFIPKSKSIGNEKPLVKDSIAVVKRENTKGNRTFYYNKFCSYLLDRNQPMGRIKKRNEGIVLSVENIVFDKEEVYIVIQIKNKSTLDYDLNFLKLSVETRQKGKKKSLQRLYQEPIFKYNLPTKVAENETVRLVYILPKFSISSERRAVLELNEKNGERNLKLKISHRFINNPN